jgi:hypothetical protein
MGWAIGYDTTWNRDVGYGVPAWCDHPKCNEKIDRGLAYVCGNQPYGGETGCGLYFCGQHLRMGRCGEDGDPNMHCPRCNAYKPPYKHPKPDHQEWIVHKLRHESWGPWRLENPEKTALLREREEALCCASV